jgi:hypothetical protein
MPKWLSTSGNQFNSWGFPQVPYSGPGLCRTEANSLNSLPNTSAEEKTTRNSFPWIQIEEYSQNSVRILQRKRKQLGIPFLGTNIKANCQNSVPNHSAEEKPAQHKTRQPKISIIVLDVRVIIEAVRCEFHKFFRGILFRSVPFRASESPLPQNSKCLGMSTFFRGITEIIPSLFLGICLERNFVPNPTPGPVTREF